MKCEACTGTGRIIEVGFDGRSSTTCYSCAGTGRLAIHHTRQGWATIALDLPSGSDSAQQAIRDGLRRANPRAALIAVYPASDADRRLVNNAWLRIDARMREREAVRVPALAS